MFRPTALPWARPRHELLLLVLVCAAVLSVVQFVSIQDDSRICQTRAFVHGRLTIGDCIGNEIDRSVYHGRIYSNKAPGMSLLAIPAVEIASPAGVNERKAEGDLGIWGTDVLCSGLCFVLMVFLVGRVAEGLAPGYGGPTLVVFALGTLAPAFAVSSFDHVPAAALGFAAFVLLWGRRPLAAGLPAGVALLVEYEAIAIVGVLAVYAVLLGRPAAARYLAGVVPGALLLGAYDWAAFGAPWRNPLSYSDNRYRAEHAKGLLGIHLPNAHAARLVFFGDRGLLVNSPVLVAAGLGLYLLWSNGRRAEAAVCVAVAAAFLVAESGYFDPYGGVSPGPRYLVPALPFLALGLGPAFARLRFPTAVLAAASVVASTTVLLTWTETTSYPGTVWTQIGHVVTQRGDSPLVHALAKNLLVWVGPDRLYSAAVVCALAVAAFALALRSAGAPPDRVAVGAPTA